MNYIYKSNYDFSNKSFLVTGGAGFIGSNLVEFLILNGARKVRVLDDLSTGFIDNIEHLLTNPAFEFILGSITNFEDCQRAVLDIDIVFHQAALGSVPRSISNPIATNTVNVSGFVNMLTASKEAGIKRFIYASSSSVYGDDLTMPKVEEKTGNLLSPYAVTKKSNELYADVFYKSYGLEVIGLRYFNVFGPKQNIEGPYAAVIPIFINELLKERSPNIFGDGSTTRDFTYIENVIQANVLSAFTSNTSAINRVYNVGYGGTTSLNTLFELISRELKTSIRPYYAPQRKGDIRDSFANIELAMRYLGYTPKIDIQQGIKATVKWYKNRL